MKSSKTYLKVMSLTSFHYSTIASYCVTIRIIILSKVAGEGLEPPAAGLWTLPSARNWLYPASFGANYGGGIRPRNFRTGIDYLERVAGYDPAKFRWQRNILPAKLHSHFLFTYVQGHLIVMSAHCQSFWQSLDHEYYFKPVINFIWCFVGAMIPSLLGESQLSYPIIDERSSMYVSGRGL